VAEQMAQFWPLVQYHVKAFLSSKLEGF
jgi:hypothetical protein